MRRGKASVKDRVAAWVGKVTNTTLFLIMALLLLAVPQSISVSLANFDEGSSYPEGMSDLVADSFRLPLDSWPVTQDFGVWNSTWGGYHLAEDAAASTGTPVYASGNGTVEYAGYASGYSGVVIIEHTLPDQSEVCTLYGHLTTSTIQVSSGQQVSKGQLVGYVADPNDYGYSGSPHIHFGIRKGAYSTSQICGHWPYVGYSQSCTGITHEQYRDMWHDPSDFVADHGSDQIELVINGGFESGLSGWVSLGDFYADPGFPHPHSGARYAYLTNADGTPGNSLYGTLYQEVSIPSSATSATLTFWYNITTQETGSASHDVLNVTIKDSVGQYLATVAVFSNKDSQPIGVYSQESFDMTPYVGQTIRIHFLGTTDGSLPTVFRIDDVSILATCGPRGAAEVWQWPRSTPWISQDYSNYLDSTWRHTGVDVQDTSPGTVSAVYAVADGVVEAIFRTGLWRK